MKKFNQILKSALVAIILSLSNQLAAQTPSWSWLTHTSGTGDEYLHMLETGPFGNVFYGGSMTGNITIEGIPVQPFGGVISDAFIAHKSVSGNHNWAIAVGGKNLFVTHVRAPAADPFGNFFFFVDAWGGAPGDSLNIGPNYFKVYSGTTMSIVVKMDSLGNVLWTNEINPGTGIFNNVDMVSTSTGDVYMAGFMAADTVLFDSIALAPIGWDAQVLAKISATGHFVWAKKFGSKGGNGQQFTITRNAQNEIYLSGGWEGDTMYVDGQYLVNPTPGGFFNTDRYISKFTAAGAVQWLRREGSIGGDYNANLAVFANGDVVCQSTVSLDPLTINEGGTTVTGPTVLYTKYDGQGNFKSYQTIGTSEFSPGLASDGTDLYMSYPFNTPQLTLGGITLTNAGGTFGTSDVAVFKLDTQYNFVWGVSFGSTEEESVNGISYSAIQGLAVGGFSSSSQLIVGSDTLNNLGTLTNEAIVAGLGVNGIGVVENQLAKNITVYPNPTKDVLHFDFEDVNAQPARVTIISSTGQVVKRTNVETAATANLNINDLAPGLYLLEIGIGQNYAVKKFIKE